ncbi:MAG: tyrosine--tRNA ligase [Treponema sp.]|nr:tyrosine--tRNA ligase [Treponema sp.]
MNPALENLKTRGFLQQCSDLDALSHLMDEGPVTFYEGTDPTGGSMHIGHMVPFFAFQHMRKSGHKGIALLGGGTARIPDPTGKSEMRKFLTYEQLDQHTESIRAQIDRFIGFDGKTAWSLNNKDWLAGLNYIEFLREIGIHFSVNRMLSFETYKMRMETGLSFIEFNYQLLQSYDFLELFRRYGCRLQIGGDDQWGNIVAGADLIRRVGKAEVYALTFPLVCNADGTKMGKTVNGAVFLDPNLTSVYDFFQYWRNIQDADVRSFLKRFTFLPVEECEKITAPGMNPNEGKERLAWEVTALVHGKDEADRAMAGARAAFGGGEGGDRSGMPRAELKQPMFEAGYNIVDLFCDAGLAATKSDGRRLVQQGGAFVSKPDGSLEAIKDPAALIKPDRFDKNNELTLRAGKKRYCVAVPR